MMELREVGTRLGLDNRILRYIMEQNLVPGLAKANQGRGTRRQLTKQQARLVGLAGALHKLGIRGLAMKKALRTSRAALRGARDDVVLVEVAGKEGLVPVYLQVNVSELKEKIT